jgi:hypothetical protein
MLGEREYGLLCQWLARVQPLSVTDRQQAEAAVLDINSGLAIPAPRIRWWKSPIAMLMAHEMLSMGEGGARTYYGEEILSVSPELGEWLGQHKQRPVLGRPLGMRTCGCRGYSSRQYAWLCPRLHAGLELPVWRARLERVRWALLDLWPQHAPFNEALHAVRMVFCHQLALKCDRGYDRPCWHGGRPAFLSSMSFWPDEQMLGVVTLELARSMPGIADTTTCMTPFNALAECTQLAILREKECWLCEQPMQCQTNAQGRLHAESGPALVYADGTRLHALRGDLLPLELWQYDGNFPLHVIDSTQDPHHLRETLLQHYGMLNYLRDRHAAIVEQSEECRLWKLHAGQRGTLHFLEDLPLFGEPNSTFSEMLAPSMTLAQAQAEAENQEWRTAVSGPSSLLAIPEIGK